MRIFFALTMLLFGIAGCSDTSPEDQIRLLIPEATSISNADFNMLATSESPSPDHVKSQSLSLILMMLPVSTIEAGPAISSDFRYLDGTSKPSVVAEAMWKSKGKGYATMVQPEFIESLDCKIVGETGVGTVSFKAVGLYAGKVEFTATRRANRWQIEEFRLPGHRLKTSRGSGGLWKKATWDSQESKTKHAQQDAQPETAKPDERNPSHVRRSPHRTERWGQNDQGGSDASCVRQNAGPPRSGERGYMKPKMPGPRVLANAATLNPRTEVH